MNIDKNKSISEVEFVFLDFETTGFSPENDKIIEIGALKIKNRKTIEEFDHLVNPQINIPVEVTNITGIKDEDVNDKQGINDLLPHLLDFLKGSIIVAHNAGFDISFLKSALKKAELQDIDNPIIDTIELAKQTFPKLGKYSLQSLASRFKFPENNAHRAIDDCYTCMRLFDKCCDEKSFMGTLFLGDLI